MNLLHTLGLMTRAEHARKVEILVDLLDETRAAESKALAQFKRAATDLAAQAAHIEDWRAALERMETDRDNWRGQALRDAPGAEAMRKKPAADRKRMAGKRNG